MINRVQYSPSFQKKLVANVDLPSQNGKEHCSIYELDEGKKDAKRLKKQIKKQNWDYSDQFIGHLKDTNNPEAKSLGVKVFSIEDEKKECLGLLRSFNFGWMKNIDYIEVNPKYQSSKKDAKVKNIGSALITYLIKSNKDSDFVVLHPDKKAYGFYDKMGFEFIKSYDGIKFELNADKVPETIKNAEEKFVSNIEILG